MSLPLSDNISLASIWGLIALPLLVAIPVYIFRRRVIGPVLAIIGCLIIVYLAWTLPQTRLPPILGQPVFFDAVSAYIIVIMSLATACLYLLSLVFSQGWTFYPLGLIMLALLMGASILRHVGLIALLIEIAVLLAVFIIQGGRIGSTKAAQRFLTLMTLAVPLLLLAARQVNHYYNHIGSTASTTAATLAALLAGIGFFLWFGVAPLHGWLSALTAEAKPGIAAFILIVFPSMTIGIVLHFWYDNPWLSQVPYIIEVIISAGLLSVILGGLFASVQRTYGYLMGYTALFDLGIYLVALGTETEAGQQVILFSLLARAIALILIATAMVTIETQVGSQEFQHLVGVASKLPLPTLALVIGGLTLAGTPFTIGFVSRWLLLQALAEGVVPWVTTSWLFVILLGSLGVVAGYFRGLYAMLKPDIAQRKDEIAIQPQSWPLNLLLASFTLGSVVLSIFPQFFLTLVADLSKTI